MPDLGQVPQLDPGIMALGLVPVVARIGGERVKRDQQVGCPGVPVASRQAPYPPCGPGWSEAVKANPGPSLGLGLWRFS